MSWVKFAELWCDSCHAEARYAGGGGYPFELARRDGWTIFEGEEDGLDECPSCTEERGKE